MHTNIYHKTNNPFLELSNLLSDIKNKKHNINYDKISELSNSIIIKIKNESEQINPIDVVILKSKLSELKKEDLGQNEVFILKISNEILNSNYLIKKIKFCEKNLNLLPPYKEIAIDLVTKLWESHDEPMMLQVVETAEAIENMDLRKNYLQLISSFDLKESNRSKIIEISKNISLLYNQNHYKFLEILLKLKPSIIGNHVNEVESFTNWFLVVNKTGNCEDLIKYISFIGGNNLNLVDLGDIIDYFDQTKNNIDYSKFDAASKLFTKSMNVFDKILILKNLNFANLLVKAGFDLSKKSGICVKSDMLRIENIDHLDVIKSAKEFYSIDMNLGEINQLFLIFSEIPDHSRKSVSEFFKNFMENSMTWNDRLATIHLLMDLDSNKNEFILNKFKNHSIDLNNFQKTALILYLSIVDKSDDEILNFIEKMKKTPLIEEIDEDLTGIEIEDMEVKKPIDSNFFKSNLIVYKNEFKGNLPKNGILEDEFLEIEELVNQLKLGKSPIKIESRDEHFPHVIIESIKHLLTKKVGRDLIFGILHHKAFKELPICQSQNDRSAAAHSDQAGLIYISSDTISKKYEHLPTGKIGIREEKLLAITLGHELVHFLHFLNGDITEIGKQEPIFHPYYNNLEEVRTITGFKKVPRIDFENLEADWDDPVEPWDYDPLNEWTLTSAFTDSDHIFYPRFSHGSEIIFRPDVRAFAKNYIFKSLSKMPNKEIIVEIGDVYFQNGDLSLAFEYYELAYENGITDPQMLTKMGNIQESYFDNYSRALEWYIKIPDLQFCKENTIRCLKKFPSLGKAITLGDAYLKKKDLPKALFLYESAATFDKNPNPQVFEKIGQIYEKLKDLKNAIAWYSKLMPYDSRIEERINKLKEELPG